MALKLTTATLALAASVSSVPANAGSEHWDRFSCYAYVHDSCYGEGNDCSKDVYNDFLDDCDDAYEESNGKRPSASLSSTARTSPDVRAKIQQSFSK